MMLLGFNFHIIAGAFVFLLQIPIWIMTLDMISKIPFYDPAGYALLSIMIFFIGFLNFFGMTLVKMGRDDIIEQQNSQVGKH